MKADFPAIWAESPATLRRDPTNAELAGGFPCGDLDLQLFNELFNRLSQIYRELSYAVVQSGQTPNQNNLTQVWAAMQSAAPGFSYGLASGTGSALVVASQVPPVKVPYREGWVGYVQMPSGQSVAANATIRFGSGDAVPLQRSNGQPVQNGDGPSGTGFLVGYYGGAWRFLHPAAAEFPKIPRPNEILYVSPTGNDTTGDGSQASPFRQPRAAALYGISNFSVAGTSLTIQIADSGGQPYAPMGSIPAPVGTLFIRGNPTNPAACVIAGTGSTGNALTIFTSGAFVLNGITFRNTDTISHTIASTGANVTCTNVILASTANNTLYAHAYSNTSGNIGFNENCSASGNMGAYFEGASGIVSISSAFSITGNPTVARATAVASKGGNVNLRANGSVTGAGVIGKKYEANNYGIVDHFGAGLNAFPGNQPGTTNNGLALA